MKILIRGGGDLGTGVALRLYCSGFDIIIAELPCPLAVRRAVSFSEAIYEGQWEVEGISAHKVDTVEQALDLLPNRIIPVLIAPELAPVSTFNLQPSTFDVIVDARLIKKPTTKIKSMPTPLIIGLGPGFTAGENCHAFVETQRGHFMGRVFWSGSAIADSGHPDGDPGRVLRAPLDGILTAKVEIGEHVEAGQTVAVISEHPTLNKSEGYLVTSPLKGVVRGLIHPGIKVTRGLKIGDIDSRDNREFCFLASEKALAIGGGVLEAILSWRK